MRVSVTVSSNFAGSSRKPGAIRSMNCGMKASAATSSAS